MQQKQKHTNQIYFVIEKQYRTNAHEMKNRFDKQREREKTVRIHKFMRALRYNKQTNKKNEKENIN